MIKNLQKEIEEIKQNAEITTHRTIPYPHSTYPPSPFQHYPRPIEVRDGRPRGARGKRGKHGHWRNNNNNLPKTQSYIVRDVTHSSHKYSTFYLPKKPPHTVNDS